MNKTHHFSKICIVFIIFLNSSLCAELYDNNNSNVINLNKKNFDTQITLNRSKNIVSVVHYYKLDDLKSRGLKKEFENLATDYDLMFKVAAMNCKDFADICEKQDVREFPTIKVYPPLPAPILNYEGKIETASLVSYMGKFIGNKVQDLNNNNIDSFVSSDANLPKCILFTEKSGIPLIFKSLSVTFDKKINFGIVRKEDSAITSKYKINNFPRILVIGVDKKTKIYDGENKFKPLFDFLNIYSETFFVVGQDKIKASDETKQEKPWLNEKFPEITKDSGNDICFKIDGVVCVVLVNKESPSKELIDLFINLQNWLSPKINRGIKYKFGWINSSTQSNFMNVIDLPKKSGPYMMLINPGKRKRFYILENEMTEDIMRDVFERLASGDLKFKNFKENNIPELE